MHNMLKEKEGPPSMNLLTLFISMLQLTEIEVDLY